MLKILAVDDSQVMRDMVAAILRNEGFQVDVADDGLTALEYAKSNHADLIVLDVNMPGMSGISLIPKLRRLSDYENTPILMLTTETDEYKKKKARSMGASGWLAKPFDPDTLVKAVNTLAAKYLS